LVNKIIFSSTLQFWDAYSMERPVNNCSINCTSGVEIATNYLVTCL